MASWFKSTQPTVAELRAREAQLRERVTTLAAERDSLSIAAAAGEKAAVASWRKAQEQLAEVQEQLGIVAVAVRKAEEAEGAAERQKLAAVHATQVNSLRTKLGFRDSHVSELVAGLSDAMAAWHKLLDTNEELRDLLAALHVEAPGALIEVHELRVAVSRELARLCGDDSLSKSRTFPGANAYDVTKMNNLAALPALEAEAKQRTAYIMALATGTRSAPAPVPTVEDAGAIEDILVAADPASAPASQTEEQPAGQTIDARAHAPRKVRLLG